VALLIGEGTFRHLAGATRSPWSGLEPWKEIPEDHLLTIDAQLRASLRPIPA